MPSYYGMSEVEFRTWYANWASVAAANAGALGLGLPETGAITTAQTNYASAVSAYSTAHDAAKIATNNKNAAYSAALALVQQWSNQWQADPAITQELILELGLNLRDTTPHPRPIYPVTGLTASANSVGYAKLSWNRNGNLPGCIFFIEASVNGGPWAFVSSTSKTRIALGPISMVPTNFRVRAERRGQFSEPSDFAGVYGAVGEPVTLHLLEEAA